MYQNAQNMNKDPRYLEPTFQQYCSDPQAPRSLQALIAKGLKARIAVGNEESYVLSEEFDIC